MPRPSFALSDDQARLLSARVAQLQASYPLDRRNHRPFVRAFLRAVQESTGQLYSPAIYQRLLRAYAPERRPSTATLAAEKQLLATEVSMRPGPVDSEIPRPVTDTFAQFYALIADAIDAALSKAARLPAQGGQTQSNFYAARLDEAERQLGLARAECARMGAELAAALQSARQYAGEAERATSALERQTAAVAALTGELADMRKFALQSIDEARGEARVWKERSMALEAQRQMDARLMESFRRQAYRQGAAIPDELTRDKNK